MDATQGARPVSPERAEWPWCRNIPGVSGEAAGHRPTPHGVPAPGLQDAQDKGATWASCGEATSRSSGGSCRLPRDHPPPPPTHWVLCPRQSLSSCPSHPAPGQNCFPDCTGGTRRPHWPHLTSPSVHSAPRASAREHEPRAQSRASGCPFVPDSWRQHGEVGPGLGAGVQGPPVGTRTHICMCTHRHACLWPRGS